MLHGACLLQGKTQDWLDFHVLSPSKRDKGWEMGGGVRRTDMVLIFVYECDKVCRCVFKCVYLCEGEVQLTCRQARVSPHGMSHDPGNTAKDTLKMIQQKSNISAEYLIKKFGRTGFYYFLHWKLKLEKSKLRKNTYCLMTASHTVGILSVRFRK